MKLKSIHINFKLTPIKVALLIGVLIIGVLPPLIAPHAGVKLEYERPTNCLEAFYPTGDADSLHFVRFLRKTLSSLELEDDYRKYHQMPDYTYEKYVARYNPLSAPSRHWVCFFDAENDHQQDVAYISFEKGSNYLYIAEAGAMSIKRVVRLNLEGEVFYRQTRYFQYPEDDALYVCVVTKVSSQHYITTLLRYDYLDNDLTELFSVDNMAQSYLFEKYENKLLLVVNIIKNQFDFYAYDMKERSSSHFSIPKNRGEYISAGTLNNQTYPYDFKSDFLFFKGLNQHLQIFDIDSIFLKQQAILLPLSETVEHTKSMRMKYSKDGIVFYTVGNYNEGLSLHKFDSNTGETTSIKQFRKVNVGDVIFYGDIDENGVKDIVYTDITKGKEAICVQQEGSRFDLLRFPVERTKLTMSNSLKLTKNTLMFHSKGVQFRILNYQRNPNYYKRWYIYAGILLLAWLIGHVLQQDKQNKEYRRQETSNRILQLQLENVQKRIDPHFIFNALNNLGSLILEGESNASYDYLSKVSNVLYKALRNKNILVTIEDELNFCTAVLDTQRQRFNGKFDYEVFIDKEVNMNRLMPSNILNSMADNCIKHGFAGIDYLGLITVELLKKEGGVLVVVEDNGKGCSAALAERDETKSTGTGLNICHQYVRLFNQHRKSNWLSFQITDLYTANDQPCGTRCEFYVPDDLKEKI